MIQLPNNTLKQQSHLKKVLTHNEHVLDHNYSDLLTTSFLLAYVTEIP